MSGTFLGDGRLSRQPSQNRRDAKRTIGVLGLQGDVREHLQALADVGARGRPVKRASDLHLLDGIIIPGGESTTLSLLLSSSGLLDPLESRLRAGMPVLGTCAGLVLLARAVLDGRPDQVALGFIDCVVRRNAYGRQAQSFETFLDADGLDRALAAAGASAGAQKRALPAVFIRAPAIEQVGPQVEVLVSASGSGHAEPSSPPKDEARKELPIVSESHGNGHDARELVPVVARQGPVLVVSFHPELTPDRRIHRLFVAMVQAEMAKEGIAAQPMPAETGR